MSTTTAAEVLRRARREAERYGDDPWVFLRELVQNARDAGASHITLTTNRDELLERIVCDDDGSGMSPALVESGLLRLFSSQKPLTGAAGCFGVGFWSTLRFDPVRVRVDTHDGKQATAIVVDVASGSVTEAAATRATRGTTVILERGATDAGIAHAVRKATRRSCGCLAALPGRSVPVLTVDGVDVRRRLAADAFEDEDPRAPVSDEGFTGVAGFGRRPRVEVYVHGLLVKEALSLDELVPSRPTTTRWAAGLWPVVVVEAPGVTVLLDRQAIVEDALVRRIVDSCEATLALLLEKLLDDLVPLPWWRRLSVQASRQAPALVLAGALVVGGGGGALVSKLVVNQRSTQGRAVATAAASGGGAIAHTSVASTRSQSVPSEEPRLLEDMSSPDAPRVDDLASDDPGWSLTVATSEPMLLLRLRVLDRVDSERGMIASTPSAPPSPLPPASGEEIATISFAARAPHQSLPSAPGTSVALLGAEAATAVARVDEDGLVTLERAPRAVRYRLVRGERAPPPPALVRGVLPPELLAVARELEGLPAAQRVRAAERYISGRLHYGADPTTRSAIESATGSYFDRVLAAGAGDCDVVNTVLAALLVETRIPARVSVGFVVQNGVVGTTLHAWTEAFVDGAITVADASPAVELPNGASASASAPLASPASTSNDATGALPGVLTDVEARPDPLARLPVVGALGALLAACVLVLALWRRRRRRARSDVDLTSLFVQALRRGSHSDPLGLRHRKFLPRHRGSPLTLSQAERLAGRGLLSVGHDDARVDRARVLVAGDARVEGVRPFLFGLVDLDRAVAALALPPDARARAVEALAGVVEPRAAARVVEGKGLVELALPLTTPRVLILLGADDAVDVDTACALYRRAATLARRRA